jgi:CRISPR/Cas system-associated protein Csm6
VNVKRKGERDVSSLAWIHAVREAQYRATKAKPLKAWLGPVDPKKAAQACRRLGLNVRLGPRIGRKRLRTG